jgi:hypothetical protein
LAPIDSKVIRTSSTKSLFPKGLDAALGKLSHNLFVGSSEKSVNSAVLEDMPLELIKHAVDASKKRGNDAFKKKVDLALT